MSNDLRNVIKLFDSQYKYRGSLWINDAKFYWKSRGRRKWLPISSKTIADLLDGHFGFDENRIDYLTEQSIQDVLS